MREIVQRTETVVRTRVLSDTGRMPLAPRPAQRLSGQPYTLPEDAIEWIEAKSFVGPPEGAVQRADGRRAELKEATRATFVPGKRAKVLDVVPSVSISTW